MKKKEYLTLPQILRHYDVARSTFDYWRRTGKFPRPVKSSVGRLRWDKERVEAFMREHKVLKWIDPSIRKFREFGHLVFIAPQGLIMRTDNGITYHWFLTSYEAPYREARLEQCPDYPNCRSCREVPGLINRMSREDKEIK